MWYFLSAVVMFIILDGTSEEESNSLELLMVVILATVEMLLNILDFLGCLDLCYLLP